MRHAHIVTPMPDRARNENGGVILLAGIAIGLFVVPDAWTLPVIGVAALLEAAETTFTYWLSRRGAPKVGVETLIGAEGRVVEPCRPSGRVRVRGEPWRARCTIGADAGDRIRVIGREGLTLVVEPIRDG